MTTGALFSFYNGELCRIEVSTDQNRTEGLTDEDLIESISARYGTPTTPAAKVIGSCSSQVYVDMVSKQNGEMESERAEEGRPVLGMVPAVCICRQKGIVVADKKHRPVDWESFIAGITRGKTVIEYGASHNAFRQG